MTIARKRQDSQAVGMVHPGDSNSLRSAPSKRATESLEGPAGDALLKSVSEDAICRAGPVIIDVDGADQNRNQPVEGSVVAGE